MEIINGLKYSFHVIFHPFDGFWDLKNEKKGNLACAWILVALTIVTFIMKVQFTGFEFNPNSGMQFNVFTQILLILLPLLLWCITNWCVTTLVDGEGTLRDIFITTAYSLVPFILINILMIVLSNILTIQEAQVYQFFWVLALVWCGFLLISGLLTIHQFTFFKTILTVLLVIAGMIIICFLALLFFALIQQVFNFFQLLYRELFVQ